MKIKNNLPIALLLGVLVLSSCKKNQTQANQTTANNSKETQAIQPQDMESAIIYEANIRQYSPKGDFNSFTKDIPKLKQLGVKIIWLMPIHPISLKKRKATSDLSIEDIKNPEQRKKYLGSYYAVADYKAINPEFGTEQDLNNLIKTAHSNGMWVILDWVANHTGWDHPWITNHPEFYTKDKDGNITDPLNEDGTKVGWTDVADLNYDNKELWEEMTNDMKYWITNFNTDGFRCDVAGMVPTEFWDYATTKLRAEKDIFMLAESEDKPLFIQSFDMGYNWEGHHIMNQLAQGKANVSQWDEYMQKIDTAYQQDDFLMNFVTNHDENSWNGTIYERMPNSWEALTALTYALPGMPLIYSGMEYDLNHRLKFFEKDQIIKEKGKMWPLLEQLAKIKSQNKDLHGGKNAAPYQRINTSNNNAILAFKRGDKFVYLANLTNQEQQFSVDVDMNCKDLINNKDFNLKAAQTISLQPWQYHMLEQQ